MELHRDGGDVTSATPVDELLASLTVPGRVVRLTWRDDVQPSGPGWIVACWWADPAPRREVVEVVATTLPEALERLIERVHR